jgi:hypothetical protein
MESKRAQGLSINTIILIILGVVVLVALIFGFTKGWDGIKQWIAPSNNIAQVKSQCDVACTTENKYDYCYAKKSVKTEADNIKDTSCYVLANKKLEYGISQCTALDGQCGIKENDQVARTFCDTINENKATTEVWYIEPVGYKLTKQTCDKVPSYES